VRRLLIITLSSSAVIVLAALTAFLLGIRYNTTASMPRGLYMRSRAAIARDALVAVCPDPATAVLARSRHYLGAGSCPSGLTPFLKRVLATPGDRVELREGRVFLNDRIVNQAAALANDHAGRPIPRMPDAVYLLASDQYWLAGRGPLSWDSRYWGPVHRSQITEVLRPLWLWSDP